MERRNDGNFLISSEISSALQAKITRGLVTPLQMPLSSESVLDNIAEYLKFISDAQSFWFMLNTSYDARAGGQSEVMAEATADAMVEVTAEATAEATAEVTEGGSMTRVEATIIRTRGERWVQ